MDIKTIKAERKVGLEGETVKITLDGADVMSKEDFLEYNKVLRDRLNSELTQKERVMQSINKIKEITKDPKYAEIAKIAKDPSQADILKLLMQADMQNEFLNELNMRTEKFQDELDCYSELVKELSPEEKEGCSCNPEEGESCNECSEEKQQRHKEYIEKQKLDTELKVEQEQAAKEESEKAEPEVAPIEEDYKKE